VVTRDAAGEIHVLSRLCRHRGIPVVEGAGNAKALTCPYHLWRYGLDGRLAAAPAMERSQVFDRDSCNLPAIASCRWNGWVFANPDGMAAPLEPQLQDLKARLAAIAPDGLVTADIISLDSPWNWKLMVENFLESYHHIGPHAGTLQLTNPGLGTWVAETGEAFTVLENPPVDDQHLAVHAEDIPACEAAQKGVTSPLYEPGPLSHLEASLWRFHRFLRRSLLGG